MKRSTRYIQVSVRLSVNPVWPLKSTVDFTTQHRDRYLWGGCLTGVPDSRFDRTTRSYDSLIFETMHDALHDVRPVCLFVSILRRYKQGKTKGFGMHKNDKIHVIMCIVSIVTYYLYYFHFLLLYTKYITRKALRDRTWKSASRFMRYKNNVFCNIAFAFFGINTHVQ